MKQATVDAKKGESGLLYVTIDWKKYVIGTLSQDHIPQMTFDLVFEQEFELSHSLESGSVHFVGYRSPNIDQEEDYPSDSEEEEEVVPATSTVTSVGNAAAASKAAGSKPKAKPAEVKPESESDDDDESEEEKDEEDDSEEEEEDEEEEEETPKQVIYVSLSNMCCSVYLRKFILLNSM